MSKQKQVKSSYYVTTPIYYINDLPHIGHAYSTIAADVLARYYRKKLGKENVKFVTGTDENSQKTIEAATAAGLGLADYTKQTANKWKSTWNRLGISYDRFIRTTNKDHIKTVQAILQKIYENGDIYKGVYEGKHCFRCEAYYKDDELIDGVCCPVHKKEVDILREENWFFKLSKYQKQILEYIESNPKFIQPKTRRNEILTFIRNNGLEDFSISRASQNWGIRLPFDKTQVAYVWFDALLNYVTAAGYGTEEFSKWWPANLHIVGKDIIKFHCLYWPGMLMSAGLELPKQVFAHGFFMIDGEKMSKSLGNAVSPVELSEKYGNDALRYFLLREIPFGNDGDFSFDRLKIVYETELANKLGNLVARVVAMLTKYNGGNYVLSQVKTDLSLDGYITNLKFASYLGDIIKRTEELNALIEETKPWELIKTDSSKVVDILSRIASELVVLGEHLEPFLPDTAVKIANTLANGRVDNSIGVLFPRIDI
jgi:methionyl-tRNA synthetase